MYNQISGCTQTSHCSHLKELLMIKSIFTVSGNRMRKPRITHLDVWANDEKIGTLERGLCIVLHMTNPVLHCWVYTTRIEARYILATTCRISLHSISRKAFWLRTSQANMLFMMRLLKTMRCCAWQF